MSSDDRKGRHRARKEQRLDRAQEQIDRAEEQVARRMEGAYERMDRAGEEAERRMADAAQRFERARDQVERHRGGDREAEPIWSRPQPGARSPRFSRQEIAAKALEIADRDGLDAVSMRRVAAELGAGTMTLYHYVGNKQELFDLMEDAMMGELLVDPEQLRSGWREALAAIANASRETWRRHPWLHGASNQRLSIGPNGIRHFDQSLEAVASTGLPLERQMEVVAQVDDYVAGYCQRENDILSAPESQRAEDWEEQLRPISTYLREQLATGEYPRVAEFVGEEDFADVVRRLVASSEPDERFERGLQRLLDGVALEIERGGD
jgi:AcrR family transcriptional regulator